MGNLIKSTKINSSSVQLAQAAPQNNNWPLGRSDCTVEHYSYQQCTAVVVGSEDYTVDPLEPVGILGSLDAARLQDRNCCLLGSVVEHLGSHGSVVEHLDSCGLALGPVGAAAVDWILESCPGLGIRPDAAEVAPVGVADPDGVVEPDPRGCNNYSP